MAKRTTLGDIAATLGLSTSTVSLALRGHRRIPERTVERVKAEAARQGYIYNRAAAQLRTSRSEMIAVSLSDLSNPIFNEFLVIIEEELRAHGRKVFLGVCREDRQTQAEFINKALEQGVGGIVICPVYGTTPADLTALLPDPQGTPAIPTASFSRELHGTRLPQFTNDDRAAGRLAGEAVIAAGHRRVCWVGGGQATSNAHDRLAGCLDAFSQAGLPAPLVRHGPTQRLFGYETARQLLSGKTPPTAFVCFSDLIAVGVVAACNSLALMPGRDVAIVGCDDMEEAAYTFPPMTTVRVDKHEIGRAAARSVVGLLPNEGVVRSAPELIMRQTVLPRDRTQQPAVASAGPPASAKVRLS